MSFLNKELLFLILQFLNEENFKETVHKLEKESGIFFNMRYFEDAVINGYWDEADKYLLGFTKLEDNRFSTKIFFEMRKQEYIEALDKRDYLRALEILNKDLKVFSGFIPEIYKEMALLLTLTNFRENDHLSSYRDEKTARRILFDELKRLIEENPLIRGKLQFPKVDDSRLRHLINQSLNWQHNLCKNPKPDHPDIRTIYVDHTCGQPNGPWAPSPATNPLMGGMPRVGGFPQLPANLAIPPAPGPTFNTPLGGWMTNPFSLNHQALSGGPPGFSTPNNAVSMLKRSRSPPTNNLEMDYETADSERVLKRIRPFGIPQEGNNMPVNILPATNPGQSDAQRLYSPDDLPKTVVANLNQSSAVTSLDFHPSHQYVLVVGTIMGDVSIWEIGSEQMLAFRDFKVQNLGACTGALQASLANEYTASVNRVVWSPDGSLLGVAYSKHIVHIYGNRVRDELQDHLEIDAHIGNVSDLAFVKRDNHLCIITCGEDKTIKVWDAVSGNKQYTFEGHEAPVYSVCPHSRGDTQFIFSTDFVGKIKAWSYNGNGSLVDYDAPGQSCTKFVYSTDGSRLFSCGNSKDGESYMVEWSESDGTVKRIYHGLGKRSVGVVQFDTIKNRFLAAGDEFVIKFWDMDNANLLMAMDVEGGLPASPCIRFNEGGMFLAVSSRDNSVKVLGNAEGIRLAHALHNRAVQNHTNENRAIEDRAIENRASENHTVENLAIENHTVENRAIENWSSEIRANENRTVENSAVENRANENRTGENSAIENWASEIQANENRTGENSAIENWASEIQANENRTVESGAIDASKTKTWKLKKISKPSQLRSLKLPDNMLADRIMRLKYTHSGGAILALGNNAVHKLWRWQKNERNKSGKATTSVSPVLSQPSSGLVMTNDISKTNRENVVPCFALSKNDLYVMSASGGRISLFNLLTFEAMTTFLPPPPAATFIAFHPNDNNVIAIGRDDSSIQIYNARLDETRRKLISHKKRVTGLAFSMLLNILISTGADAQICVWSTDKWERQKRKYLKIPSGRVLSPFAHTRVQFHQDQKQLLVVHETQIAIYEAPNLECIKQWVPQEEKAIITDATYSCDGQSVFASFEDGSVSIFTSPALGVRCRISPRAYLPSGLRSIVYPLSITAHPSVPNQLALGLTDGSATVLEPLEEEGNWGTAPPEENGVGPSSNGVAANSDQHSRSK